MVRATAAIAALTGLLAFVLFLHLLGKGPFERLEVRHLREMKDRLGVPDSVEPLSFAGFFTLPETLSVAEYSGLERRAVAVIGRVRVIIRASDGDLHLELIDADGADPRYLTAEITPGWRGAIPPRGVDSPGWGFERLAAIFRADHAPITDWDGGPAKVRLSGWLLYDHVDEGLGRWLPLPHVRRPTDWEIHPVTRIERWDEALASWIEVAR